MSTDSELKYGSDQEQLPLNDIPQQKLEVDNLKNRKKSETYSTPNDANQQTGRLLTTTEAVEHIGMGKFQLLVVFLCGIFNFADACEMLLLSVLGPALQCEWFLEEYKVAFITTVVFIGYLIMAPIWGGLSDVYGRRNVLVAILIWLTFYGLQTAFAPSYIWVLLLRAMVGGGIAGTGLSYVLPSEYSPVSWRARLLVGNGIFWTIGSMFEIGMAAAIIPNVPSDSRIEGWRILVLVTTLPVALSLISLKWLPESARYLATAGREHEADLILEKACEMNNRPKLPGKLAPEPKVPLGDIRDLFRNGLALTTIGSWFLWFTAAFVYYGMILISALLFDVKNRDCSQVVASASSMNDTDAVCSCRPMNQDTFVSMLITTSGEFGSIFLNLVTLDVIGRKKSMALYVFVQAVAFFLLIPCAMPSDGMTALIFVIRGMSYAYFNAVYIYACELYPTRVRSLALGSFVAAARVGAIITPFIAQVLLNHDRSVALAVYGGLSAVAGVVCLAMPYETKGKEQEDI